MKTKSGKYKIACYPNGGADLYKTNVLEDWVVSIYTGKIFTKSITFRIL